MSEVHLTPRRALLLVASIALLVAAACTAPIAAAPSARPSGPVSTAPDPTPVPMPSATPAATPASTPAATPAPPVEEGNVDGDIYPELTVESIDIGTLRLTLDDPSAKAWRLVISGVGDLRFDKLEILVETSDISPLITAREIRDSEVVSEMDLSGYAYGNGAAGGCHATLGVCIDSDGFRLPKDGNGRFRFRLSVADVTGPLAISASTAGWPGEPFILGPWVDTDTLNWSA